MALTRITSNVIKDNTIEEGKFNKPYLDSSNADTAQQAITFQSDLTIQVGAGPTYFSASNNLVTLTGTNSASAILSLSVGGLSLGDGDINLTGTHKVQSPFLDVGNGTSTTPGLFFGGETSTGFYRTTTPTESVNLALQGSDLLSLQPTEFKFGTNNLQILTNAANTYTQLAGYDTASGAIEFGGANESVEIKVKNATVIDVRSEDALGNSYTNNENRVGINTQAPAATLDVNGTIRATSFQGPSGAISADDLPVIPINKGGTNTTTIGTPTQLLRVNENGDGFEYFDQSTGDPNNLKSFGVAGDGNIYTVTTRDNNAGQVRLKVSDAATFVVDHEVKVFGINTTNYNAYDVDGGSGTFFDNWSSDIDGESLNLIAAQGPSGGTVQYTYYACLMNTVTGVISTPKKLKHSGPQTQEYVVNYPLGTFNDQIYNSVPLRRPVTGANHAILLYRYVNYGSTNVPEYDRNETLIPNHNDNVNLIAIIGNRDIGAVTTSQWVYNDYGPYQRTSWGDFNTDGTYNQNFQKVGNIPCSLPISNITQRKARPGWAYRTVTAVDYVNDKITISNPASNQSPTTDTTDTAVLSSLDLNGFDGNNKGFFNSVQICHDDTVPLQTAIDQQESLGLNSLYVIGGTYLVRRLNIPADFSFLGSGKATIIKKQFFDTEYQKTAGAVEFSRFYCSLFLRDPGSSVSVSQPIKNVTVRDMVIDGNYNSQTRLGLNTTPQANALIYCEDIENASFSSLDVKNSVGDGIYAKGAKRMSLQNCTVFDNSITYLTFDNPLQATNAEVLRASNCAFLATPGPVDITTSEVVAFNSCIIRNCGTGIRIYGARSANTENNLVLGPDDEWIPTEDIYDSDYNSVNITVDKTTGTGTGGDVKFTFVEDNLAKDMTNTTVSAKVYKIIVDTNGNETIVGEVTYRQDGLPTNPEISVLSSSVFDAENGGVQIKVVSGIDAQGNYEIFPATNTQAVHSIPYRTTLTAGTINTNYNYLAYSVVGQESLAIGSADEYIIDGVIGYNSTKQQYEIKIDTENVSDFAVGDIVTLKEHNTGYSLPANLTVTDFGFAQQSFTLILSFTGGFNSYHDQLNSSNGWNSQAQTLSVDATARGYIEKKRSFTIAKGIIGVV
tara:strand:- start:3670 stop:7035 length:3366 start_codon:yes stop_codon:yes gene_type:complete